MRKKLSLFLVMVLLFRIFCLTVAAADHDHDHDAEKPFSMEEEVPVYVTQVDYISRYAVDVIYSDMNIQVESAVWDVNDHYYVVTMEDLAEQEVFKTMLTVVNHSDQPILADVDVSLGSGLELLSTSTVGERTVSGVPILPKPPDTGISETFLIHVYPTNGWTPYINTLIAKGIPDNNLCTAGTVTLTVKQIKDN